MAKIKFFHFGQIKEHFDTWSFVHFFGSYFLAGGFLWEVCDGLYSISKEPEMWDDVFDRRGFSWVDLVLDFTAVLILALQ